MTNFFPGIKTVEYGLLMGFGKNSVWGIFVLDSLVFWEISCKKGGGVFFSPLIFRRGFFGAKFS